jgi:rRNA-processing protein FCF1
MPRNSFQEVIVMPDSREASVKYTAVLPSMCMDELKSLAMQEATADKDFMRRALETQEAFSEVDAEDKTE